MIDAKERRFFLPGNDQASIIVGHDSVVIVEEDEKEACHDAVDERENIVERTKVARRL